MKRPHSYSEGFIHIPVGMARTASNLYPLLSESPEDFRLSLASPAQKTPSPPSGVPKVPSAPFFIEMPQPQPISPTSSAAGATAPTLVISPVTRSPACLWPTTAHIWALRFSLHLVLISAFETLFFWLFVSKSEDAALIGLVNGYTNGALSGCANLTVSQRTVVNYLFYALFNATAIDVAGNAATVTRTAYNTNLLGTSWTYVGTIAAIFAGLVAATRFSPAPRRFEWRGIIGENLGLITMLGLYEWMFFHTIVFRYESVSMPELDRMVVSEFSAACGLQMLK